MPTRNAPTFGAVTVDSNWKVAIVRSMWHDEMTSALATDAKQELITLGMKEHQIREYTVPGAWELPLACTQALKSVDAVIAFGVLVDGDTYHAALIAREVSSALMDIQVQREQPIVFELLYTKNTSDAKKRSLGAKKKGKLAAKTLLTSLAKLREI